MGIPGAVGFFASHYKFSFSRPRLRSPPPLPDTAAGLTSSGPSQQSVLWRVRSPPVWLDMCPEGGPGR